MSNHNLILTDDFEEGYKAGVEDSKTELDATRTELGKYQTLLLRIIVGMLKSAENCADRSNDATTEEGRNTLLGASEGLFQMFERAQAACVSVLGAPPLPESK